MLFIHKSMFSLLHVLVIAIIMIILSSSMIYSSSAFDQGELANCITALECTKLAALSFNLDGKLDPELGTGFFFCIKFVSTPVSFGEDKKVQI